MATINFLQEGFLRAHFTFKDSSLKPADSITLPPEEKGSDTPNQKPRATKHWFVLKQEGQLIHSSRKSLLDVYGDYINLGQFNSVDKDDATGPDSFILHSQRGVTVHFTGDNRDTWIKNMAAFTKAETKPAPEAFARQQSSSLLKPKDESSPRRPSDSSNNSRDEADLSNSSEENTAGGDRQATPKRSNLAKALQAQQNAVQATATKATKQGPQTVYSLFCKVSEVKMPKTAKPLDVFAVVNVDHDRRRTRTIQKTLNPLWADDFTIDVADPAVSRLRVSLWEDGRALPTIVSKVDLPLDNLTAALKEDWFPLSYARPGAYVSGDLHVRIDRTGEKLGTIFVTVVEARNVDVYSKREQAFFVQLVYGKQTVKTKAFTVKPLANATLLGNAEWNEQFNLNFDDSASDFVFSVHRKATGNPVCGTITMSKLIHFFEQDKLIDQWLVLEPIPEEVSKEKEKQKSQEKLGDIRMTLRVTKALVYDLDYYEPLLRLLLDDDGKSAICSLERVVSGVEERNNIALGLVRIYEAKNRAPLVLRTLISHEVRGALDVDTLFRANSLASKAVEMYMKTIGYNYLQGILEETIDKLYQSKKNCEIDPIKLEKGDDPKRNYKFLISTLDELLETIYSSADDCPPQMRTLFQHVQKEVKSRFPQDQVVRYTGVSGFLFLRLVCAAILGPKLFDLKADHPEPKVAKNLTNIAKTIQRIANMSPTASAEGALGDLETYIEEQKLKMKAFLDQVATPNEDDLFDPAAVDLRQELSILQERLEGKLGHFTALFTNKTDPASAAAGRMLEALDSMNEHTIKEKKREPVLLKDKATGEVTVAAKYLESATKAQLVPASEVVISSPDSNRERRASKATRKRGSESEGTDGSSSSSGKDLSRQRSMKRLQTDDIESERPRAFTVADSLPKVEEESSDDGMPKSARGSDTRKAKLDAGSPIRKEKSGSISSHGRNNSLNVSSITKKSPSSRDKADNKITPRSEKDEGEPKTDSAPTSKE